jgi:GNAT superfamily N-acetyltransferase
MIRVRLIDATTERNAALLQWLQLEALPGDTPADTQRGHWWVAFDGTTPAAFAGLYPSAHKPNAGYLCRAGVLKAFRGQRLQRRLIDARIRKAKALGFKSVHTDTIAGNPASSNNLIACGFRMFTPNPQWAGKDACYWNLPLTP